MGGRSDQEQPHCHGVALYYMQLPRTFHPPTTHPGPPADLPCPGNSLFVQHDTMDEKVIVIMVILLAASASMCIGAALLFGLSMLGPPDAEAPGSQQQQASESEQRVVVYDDAGRKGESQDFGIGNHDLAGSVWNNRISSVLVPEGLKLTVYEGGEGSAQARFFPSPISDLNIVRRGKSREINGPGCLFEDGTPCWNDVVSYLKVERA